PASSHVFGRRARQALENAREQIAALLDAHPDEIIFTSGATEANNLAIFGLAGGMRGSGHVVSSPIEHPCVAEPIRQLAPAPANKGRSEQMDVLSQLSLPVSAQGSVDVEATV